MRPTTFKVDNTIYWSIRTFTDAGVLVDADSTPTVAVRKNGASTADAVTVTKRAATTGIYDCSYNPAGEAEGDCFTIEETATVSSQAYEFAWGIEAQAAERGTDNASTFDPASDAVANVTLVDTTTDLTNQSGGGGDATAANQTTIINAINGLNDFNPATDTVANVTLVATTTTNTDMRGTDGANTVAPVDVSSDVTAILADTNELQLNQNNWLTATGFSTFDASTDTVTTDTASRDASKADVSGLSTFDHTSDQVVASNMRGTDNAILASSAPSNWSTLIIGTGADAGKVTTSNPASGSGSAHTAQDVADLILVTPANKLATDASGNVEANNMRGTDGANTIAPVDVSSDVAAILADTNELQLNQGNWLTATGFNTVAPDNAGIAANNSAIAALNDLSALDVENAVWDATVSSHTVTDSYGLRSLVALNSNRTLQITGSHHTAADVHEFQPNTLTSAVTDASFVTEVQSGLSTFDASTDQVVASNMRGTDGANTVTPVDVSGAIAALNDFNPATDTVARVTLVDTTTDLTNQSGGGGGASAADIYNYFTDGTREDAFKADTSGLSTFDPASDTVARVTLVDTTTDLTNGGGSSITAQEIVDAWGNQDQSVYTTQGTLGYYLDAQVSSAGSGGTGLYQATVKVQDISGNALQGARVNVDGTTLTLTTGTNGEVTFNLDSGVYLFEVSPPANYDTPSGQVLTVTTSDPADTVFALTETTPSSGCDVAWL